MISNFVNFNYKNDWHETNKWFLTGVLEHTCGPPIPIQIMSFTEH
jgi:hypothetical protein